MRRWIALLASLAAQGCEVPAAVPLRSALPREPVATLSGEQVELSHVTKGRVALVSFWATWCLACGKELDALNRLSAWAEKGGTGMVIGVAVGETSSTVNAFVRSRGVRYLQLLDESFRLADALGQRDVPTTLVLDRKGEVVYRGEALDADAIDAFRRAVRE